MIRGSLKKLFVVIIAITSSTSILFTTQAKASEILNTFKEAKTQAKSFEMNIINNYTGTEKWSVLVSSGSNGDNTDSTKSQKSQYTPSGEYNSKLLNVTDVQSSILKVNLKRSELSTDNSIRGTTILKFINTLTKAELLSISDINFNYYYDVDKLCLIQSVSITCSIYTYHILVIWKNGGVIYYEEV